MERIYAELEKWEALFAETGKEKSRLCDEWEDAFDEDPNGRKAKRLERRLKEAQERYDYQKAHIDGMKCIIDLL